MLGQLLGDYYFLLSHLAAAAAVCAHEACRELISCLVCNYCRYKGVAPCGCVPSHGISLSKLAVAADQDASALHDLGFNVRTPVSQHLILRERRIDHGLVAR